MAGGSKGIRGGIERKKLGKTKVRVKIGRGALQGQDTR